MSKLKLIAKIINKTKIAIIHCFIKLYLKDMLGNLLSNLGTPSEKLSRFALMFRLYPYLLGVLGMLLEMLA